ncbi:hypothetical protein EER27_06905 [Lysobacter psychrotolerans]|uniref:Uncharacterized protein n=2 Tax=Montanilutibacter psychrotolerans TaxID=1327343 RepID=A0A3M8SZ09_9GAMM|nr:hypothetical protein EER27_06905 [Lysobacter psychrotolerans]
MGGLLGLGLVACAAAGGVSGGVDAPDGDSGSGGSGESTAIVGTLNGDGPFQQFIVKYRGASAPGRDSAQVPARLAATAPSQGLAWQRRLGVEADVFRTARPLDRAQAQALMQRFAADPDVEYIEADGVVTHQPVLGSGQPLR